MPGRGRDYVSLAERGIIRSPLSGADGRVPGDRPGEASGRAPDGLDTRRRARLGPGAAGPDDRPVDRRPGLARGPAVGAGRHVWVRAEDGVWLPGLLEWRRASDGWSGLVAIAVPDTLITVMWLPAEHLRPGST